MTRKSLRFLWLVAALSCLGNARGQAGNSAVSVHQLALDAAAGELRDLQFQGDYLRYRVHQVDAKGDQVRDVIESRDGTVARLILRDGRPLTRAEDAAEHDRLQAMLDSPQAFSRHIKNDQSGKKTAADLIKVIPDAMLFSFTPGQPQRPQAQSPEIVLDFTPKPGWSAPNLVSEALTGIRGRMWLDSSTHHLCRLEANVFQSVNIGFGMFAKVYPGGRIVLEQVRTSDNRWIYAHFIQHLTVRALMFKTIKQNSDLQAANYAAIPAMTYSDAIRLLLQTPLPK